MIAARLALQRLLQVLNEGLRAALLLRPSTRAQPLSPRGFLFVSLLFLAAGLLLDTLTVPAPREFDPWALSDRGFALLLALLGGGLLAAASGRPLLWLRLAAVGLVAAIPLQLGWTLWLDRADRSDVAAIEAAIVGYAMLVALRLSHWSGARGGWRLPAAALPVAAIASLALLLLPGTAWWWPQWSEDEVPAPIERHYSAEALLYAQPALLSDALARLRPQRPDRIDLYGLAFGGDGAESVFRNEVEHFERLMSQRLSSPGRVVSLVNHPGTLGERPLATLANLRLALRGIGRTIDPDQDLLLLFLTSHGSEDHRLHVALDDLPLDPIRPQDLRAALDDAGILWRVLIVSACYSGGFIEALEDPHTLILTAARADRPSFGCGTASDITWFGQALLAEALNETTDFVAAFEQARRAIRSRERAQDELPSRPQIAVGDAIRQQLADWRSQSEPGAPVPFLAAVPAAHGASDIRRAEPAAQAESSGARGDPR